MSLAIHLGGVAARLVAKHGADIVVTARASAPEREVGKPWRGTTGTEKVTVTAVQYDYDHTEGKDAVWRNSHSRFFVPDQDTAGNQQFAVVDITTAIDLEDLGGNVWSVESVEVIKPGKDKVAYILYAVR